MPAPASEPNRAFRATERGISIIELVVVMLILAILITAASARLRSVRTAADLQTGITAAQVYVTAIEQYAGDHRGTYPTAIGSASWPTGANGPLDPLARFGASGNQRAGRYVRSIPEPVTSGLVTFERPGRNTAVYLRYVPTPASAPTAYQLQVYSLRGSRPDRPTCVFASDPRTIGSMQQCSG